MIYALYCLANSIKPFETIFCRSVAFYTLCYQFYSYLQRANRKKTNKNMQMWTQIAIQILAVLILMPTIFSSTPNEDNNDVKCLLFASDRKLKIFNSDTRKISTMRGEAEMGIYSVDYSPNAKCIFWTFDWDKKVHCVCSNGSRGMLPAGMNSLGRIAYDSASNQIFYIAHYENDVSVIEMPSGEKKIIHLTDLDSDLKDVAVHSKLGYVFWASKGIADKDRTCIQRAKVDGSDVRILIRPPQINWPKALAIDYETNRLYWTDWMLDSIHRSDFDGNQHEVVIQFAGTMTFPFALAVHRNEIYWSDDNRNSLFRVALRNNTRLPIRITNPEFSGMDTIINNNKVRDIQLVPCSILDHWESYAMSNLSSSDSSDEEATFIYHSSERAIVNDDDSNDASTLLTEAPGIQSTTERSDSVINSHSCTSGLSLFLITLAFIISLCVNVYLMFRQMTRKQCRSDDMVENLLYFNSQAE